MSNSCALDFLKLSLPILLLVSMPCLGKSQSPTVDCSQDSTTYLAFSKMLDTVEIGNMYVVDLLLPYTVFTPGKKRDCFCDLLIYTRLFDFMLEKGLDLNYTVGQYPPVHNSTNLPTPLRQIESNNKYYTFRYFLKFKHDYEKSVLKRYKRDKNRNLTQDIDNLIKYHIYAFPSTLRNILIGKYTHLTEEKLQAEIDQFYGAPKH